MADDDRQFRIEQVELPPDLPSETYEKALDQQYAYSVRGLVLGLICVLAGLILFVAGIVGHTNWTVEVLGLKSTLSDAAPGAILAVVGVIIVFATRYEVTTKGK